MFQTGHLVYGHHQFRGGRVQFRRRIGRKAARPVDIYKKKRKRDEDEDAPAGKRRRIKHFEKPSEPAAKRRMTDKPEGDSQFRRKKKHTKQTVQRIADILVKAAKRTQDFQKPGFGMKLHDKANIPELGSYDLKRTLGSKTKRKRLIDKQFPDTHPELIDQIASNRFPSQDIVKHLGKRKLRELEETTDLSKDIEERPGKRRKTHFEKAMDRVTADVKPVQFLKRKEPTARKKRKREEALLVEPQKAKRRKGVLQPEDLPTGVPEAPKPSKPELFTPPSSPKPMPQPVPSPILQPDTDMKEPDVAPPIFRDVEPLPTLAPPDFGPTPITVPLPSSPEKGPDLETRPPKTDPHLPEDVGFAIDPSGPSVFKEYDPLHDPLVTPPTVETEDLSGEVPFAPILKSPVNLPEIIHAPEAVHDILPPPRPPQDPDENPIDIPDQPVVDMDVETDPWKPPPDIHPPEYPHVSDFGIAPGPTVDIQPIPDVKPELQLSEPSTITIPGEVTKPLTISQQEPVTIAADSPKKPGKEPTSTVKPPKQDTAILKQLRELEKAGKYRPRMPRTMMMPSRSAPVTVTQGAPAIGLGGRGQQAAGQSQKQFIVMKGAKKRRPKSRLSEFRKLYTATRKTKFTDSNKSKKSKLEAYKKKAETIEHKPTRNKAVSVFRKQTNTAHTAWKKKYPTASKIKEISTLQALLSKLKRDAF